MLPGGQQLPQAGKIESRSRRSLPWLPKLDADLEVAAFELELANIIFFQELNQFLQLFDFIRRHESLVCFRGCVQPVDAGVSTCPPSRVTATISSMRTPN